MKLTLRRNYSRWRNFAKIEEFEINCKGSGSKEDPLVIDSFLRLPTDFDIMESDLYILIKDCTLKYVNLLYSKNITIENTTFEILNLCYCSYIKIQKIRCDSVLFIVCHNCSFEDSRSQEWFQLYKCFNNVFKNCEIWNIFWDILHLSRGNIFENNQVHRRYEYDSKIIQKPLLENYKTFSVGGLGLLTELICKGNGTKADPAIFDYFDQNNQEFDLRKIIKNRHFLIFKNFKLKYVKLIDSQHIIFENCSFSEYINLKFCSDIKMKSISTNILKFGASKDVIIENSDIQILKTFKKLAGTITLKNCIIKKIKKNAIDKINHLTT